MNLYLHGIGGEESPITVGDTLISDPGIRFDKVLIIPPFSSNATSTLSNQPTIILKQQNFDKSYCNRIFVFESADLKTYNKIK